VFLWCSLLSQPFSITVKSTCEYPSFRKLRIVQAASEVVNEVKENQVVRKGDAIAIIDDSQLQTKTNCKEISSRATYNLLKSMLKSTPRLQTEN